MLPPPVEEEEDMAVLVLVPVALKFASSVEEEEAAANIVNTDPARPDMAALLTPDGEPNPLVEEAEEKEDDDKRAPPVATVVMAAWSVATEGKGVMGAQQVHTGRIEPVDLRSLE